jgi:peptide deformylase
MIREVCYYGNPILRKKAEKVQQFDEDLKKLIDDMIETMLVKDGVGLAAPQIGASLRIAIVDPDPSKGGLTRLVLINPEVEAVDVQSEVMEEGCLSVPGVYAKVKRASAIRVKSLDAQGREQNFDAAGFLARVVQHEVDHLNGVLFVDKVLPKDRIRVEKELREFEKIHV